MSDVVGAISAFGPDFPFAYDDWLGHVDGLGSVPTAKHGSTVAVVGAGIAGIVAAYELMKLGLRPVLYEAGRIGGRLRSEPFSAAPEVVAELGGMRFPTSARAFYHYVDLIGLETRPFPNPLTPYAPTTVVDLEGVSHFAETIDDLPELFHQVAAAWESALEEVGVPALKAAIARRDHGEVRRLWNELVDEWDDRTFYDFIATSRAFSQLSFRHREVFGQVGFGTGGWDSDFPNSMLEIFRVVVTELEENQRLIVGGAEQLPRGLWELPVDELVHWPAGTSLKSLHNGAPRPVVAKIDATADERFEVTDRWGHVAGFDAVLVAAQSWLLTTSMEVDEQLLPQPVWMALDRTRYMQSSKTFVMVDGPFWKDINPATGRPTMSMTLTDRNTRGTYLFDNGPDQPAVICLSYAWQSDAMKVLAMSAAERAGLAIETLETIYPNADLPSHVIGEPITVSWEADPLFLGAFKGAQPGHYRYNYRMYSYFMQQDLPAQQQGLFLAGDDTSWTPGWAEGAVQTALNSVWGIVRHLGGSTAVANPGPGDVWAERQPVVLGD
jgi:monoamine oxidase